MKTPFVSDPGHGDSDQQRPYLKLTRESFRPGDCLRADRPENLAAAIESIEGEGRLYADSGVDFVAELDGQTILGQAKTHVPRHQPTRQQLLVDALVIVGSIALAVYLAFTRPIGLAFFATGAAMSFLTTLAARAARKKWGDEALARFSASGLTDLAALLAGHRRPALRAEWRAHLAGESGHDPVTWRKVKDAVGFVASAIQYRLADAADAAWTPADAILKSRKLSNLLVFGPTATAAMCILRHLGTLGVLTSAESISAIGGGLYTLVRVGRWWRDVKPPEPKARRVKE